MDARLRLRVQRYGRDAAVAHYHTVREAQLRPAHKLLLEMARPKPGQRIFETACGSDLFTRRIAEKVGAGGYVLATDLSPGMIDDLQMRIEDDSIATVEAKRMSVEKLDVFDGVFAAAIGALGLMYTPDPAAAVAEMTRVVAPGGTVAATVWGERRNCGWAEVFPIVDARVASEVCPIFFGTGAPNALVRLFENTGLTQVEKHRQFEILTFKSKVDVVDAVLLGGPVALAVKRSDKDVWQEIRQEFLSSVVEYNKAMEVTASKVNS